MIKITNTTNEEIILVGKLLRESGSGDDSYLIPELDLPLWSSDDKVIQNISNGNIELESNGVQAQSINDAINILKGLSPSRVESTSQAFASKVLPNGSKIFRRVRGISGTVHDSPVTIDFVVPYPSCKITGLQILGAELGDKATFQVLDTEAGTVSGVSKAVLNTFGEDVYISAGSADYPSRYDADLFQNLTLRIVYTPKAGGSSREVYINYDLHQVV